MKPTRVQDVLSKILTTRWPAFIWGPPGVGKSSIVKEIAESKKWELLDIRASLLDPTDLRGIPAVENGQAKWCPPSFLPYDDSKGILFFDELNAAPPLVQASLYQLTFDRRIGEYRLPDGWKIIAAGNRAEDSAVTFRMPSALANRFIHLDYEVNFEDWRAWATRKHVYPLVTAFLSTRQELLFDISNPDKGFPTPRSWEMASDILKVVGHTSDVRDLLIGIIGEGAAVEFMGYCADAISEELIKKILANPNGARLPKKLSDQYALISYVTAMAASNKKLDSAAVLINRLKPELGMLLLRNVLQIRPRFINNADVRNFMNEHKDLVV